MQGRLIVGASYASMPGAAGSLAGFAADGRPVRQLRPVGPSVDNVLPDISTDGYRRPDDPEPCVVDASGHCRKRQDNQSCGVSAPPPEGRGVSSPVGRAHYPPREPVKHGAKLAAGRRRYGAKRDPPSKKLALDDA